MENTSKPAGSWLSLPSLYSPITPNPSFSGHESISRNLALWLPSSVIEQPFLVFTTLFVAYVCLCRSLRHRREHALGKRFGYGDGSDRAALSRMTVDEAQQIIRCLSNYEFPLFNLLSLEFALFKVSFHSIVSFPMNYTWHDDILSQSFMETSAVPWRATFV